jgi:D-sedoheptulose 7-phosphate isomerase
MSRVEFSTTRDLLHRSVGDAVAVCNGLLDDGVTAAVEVATDEIIRSLQAGGKVLMCGNGGSAADAQHLVAELIGRFCMERRSLPAIALADNISALTAIANDDAYDEVFARAVRGLGGPDDVLIGLSTSGSSANVVAALIAADEMGLSTIALVGRRDCPIAEIAGHVICVQGPNTARIQEGQMLVGHTIFESVERALCAES